ncbi:MAG: hypothetical protein ACERIH_04730 [Labilibaculum antarcticum]
MSKYLLILIEFLIIAVPCGIAGGVIANNFAGIYSEDASIIGLCIFSIVFGLLFRKRKMVGEFRSK